MSYKYVLYVLFLISISISAQVKIFKGCYSIGGSISYSERSYQQPKATETVFEFRPNIGYFFIDNLYTSININYTNDKDLHYPKESWSFGPGIRYYFQLDRIAPFAGVNYMLRHEDPKFEYSGSHNTEEINFLGGVNYFLSNSVALELSIIYSIIDTEYECGPTDNCDPAYLKESNAFRLGLGVNYFLD